MPFGFFALGIISVILLSTCAEGELRRGDWANDDVDKRSLVKRFDPDQVHYLGLDKRSSEEFSDDPYIRKLENGGFRMGFGKRSVPAKRFDPYKLHHMGLGKRAAPSSFDVYMDPSELGYGIRGFGFGRR
ncbi:hypothetical protein DdX_08978 [Ditylenchus destructor]|uniref:Uncharacterized protein n=1 Tax=Ditylenchus destructor TaxID=166010 RepID=A0AAD4R6U9_9BILA|nr:hypothetical protein DdX_08978 [Ditylenchus destructor]